MSKDINKLMILINCWVIFARQRKIRLISARKAEKHERNDYYRENAQEWNGGWVKSP